ncbi:flavin-containing monooxygenase [Microbacterium oleivorans]|uniref:flavin-containing monooxygenase n=1 Tax=Microbacterium oleivorans TaxID=273677 RepID=UPI00203CAC52|nr:NAD(P)/FAD-dependent oxidoreductase [Microbacterium oleivorans]MCM3695540.1 NAD(P)/FAD-dependent oxidoreductase [Microbacterium oleivorans]
MSGHAEVVVVGAGFAGVLAAIELREAGHEVVVVERADRVGGTWRENVYPGVACDVPSHLYSLERHPNPAWSAEFAPGAEIAAYLDAVVDREGLRDAIRFGTEMTDAAWDPVSQRWRLAFSGGGPDTADALVLGCGRLSQPRIPDVPGLSSFPGPVGHTARWDETEPVAGSRIAVVGTGSSAAQLVPELVRSGAEVVLFQRSPAWVLPRGDRPYDARDAERFAVPGAVARERARLAAGDDERFAARSGRGTASARARRAALAHLAAGVPDRALRRALTPAYAFGCKRVVLSDTFYPTVAGDAVTLEASALASVAGRRLVGASGGVHDRIDRIVLATGFETTRQAYADIVRGEGGLTLAEHWKDGMSAVASTLVAGFPNLFVMNGPHSALPHASSLLVLEQQAAFIRRMIGGGVVVRVDADAEARASADVAARAAGTAWLAGCGSWYLDDRSGGVGVLWPGTVADMAAAMADAERSAVSRTERSVLTGGSR